jgi:hypothetical protein
MKISDLPLPVTDLSGWLTMTPIDAPRFPLIPPTSGQLCGFCNMSKSGLCVRHGRETPCGYCARAQRAGLGWCSRHGGAR